MNIGPEAKRLGIGCVDGAPQGLDGGDAMVIDYLEHLSAPLLGIAPYAARQRLRAEAHDHLLGLIEDFEAEGLSTVEAVASALKEYGEPWRIGQEWAESWLGGKVPDRLSRVADFATLWAFGWFGVFTVINLLAVEGYALEASWADMLPRIECLAVVSPMAAGAFTGMGLTTRTSAGICRAVAALCVPSAAIGLLLPHHEGLLLAAFQLVVWLPVGCLSAAVAASLRRQLRLATYTPWQTTNAVLPERKCP